MYLFQIDFGNVIVSNDASVAFAMNKATLTKWLLQTGRREWEENVSVLLANGEFYK
jgi:hypothetical protein